MSGVSAKAMVVLGFREDLEERLPLAGHADSGVAEGLGGVLLHQGMVAGGGAGVKRADVSTVDRIGCWFYFHGIGFFVRVGLTSGFGAPHPIPPPQRGEGGALVSGAALGDRRRTGGFTPLDPRGILGEGRRGQCLEPSTATRLPRSVIAYPRGTSRSKPS